MATIGDMKITVDADTSKAKAKIKELGNEKVGDAGMKGLSNQIGIGILKFELLFELLKKAISAVWNTAKQFFQDAIKYSQSYESAFAGVKKTVDTTAEGYVKLKNELKKMSKEIPVSFENLAGIMELGGQLGVQEKNLSKFTKVIAELGVATNLTGEEAAQMLAQYANITKMDLNDIDKLGSVIVDLGNNFATTESDIVNFAQRIAGAGQIAGISQANIMAIAAAFSSVGIEAEAGGTAVQKVLLDMNSAVVEGGDQLRKYASITGMTTEEFKKLYNEHPEKIFEQFIKSMEGAGQEAQLLLSDLGLNDQRLTRGFLSLSQNADLLTDAINRSNSAWSDNVALSNEAQQRFSTVESQIQMLENQRANALAAVGDKLQGVVLLWERIKTGAVELTASILGISQAANETTARLEGELQDIKGELEEVYKAFLKGEITLDEWIKKTRELEKQHDKTNKALKSEKESISNLEDEISKHQSKLDNYMGQYEGLTKQQEHRWGRNKYNQTALAQTKQKIAEEQEEIARLIHKQEIAQETSQRLAQQQEYLGNLELQVKEAQKQLTEAQNEYNRLQVDDSTTREELEASKTKVDQLTIAYNQLATAQANALKASTTFGPVAYKAPTKNEVLNALKIQLDSTKKSADEAAEGVDNVINGGGSGGSSKTKDTVKEVEKEIDKLEDAYDDMEKKMKAYQSAAKTYLNATTEYAIKVKKEIRNITDSLKELEKEKDKALEDIQKDLNDSNKSAIDSYLQSQYTKQLDLEKAIKNMERGHDDEGNTVEYDGQELEKNKKQVEEIKKIIDDLGESTKLGDEYIKNITDSIKERYDLSEAEQAVYDLNKQLEENEQKALKAKEDELKKYEEEKQKLERKQKIMDALSQMSFKNEKDLYDLQKSDAYEELSVEEQNIVDKYAMEKLELENKWRDANNKLQDYYASEKTLMEQNHIVSMNNVKSLNSEYSTLLSRLSEAISRERTLIALQRQSGHAEGGYVYADGGYTGPGGKYEPAGIVHKGEYVIPQWMVNSMSGLVGQLESIRSGASSVSSPITNNTTNKNQTNNITVNNGVDLKGILRRSKRYF